MSRNAQIRQSSPRVLAVAAVLFFVGAWALLRADQGLPVGDQGTTARVIIVQDPGATDAYRPIPDHIDAMVTRGITNLTGLPTTDTAWRSLASTQDVIGIKVYSVPGPNTGTHVAVVDAIIRQLLAAGWPAKNIVVWDKHRLDLRSSGFLDLNKRYGVQVSGSAEAGYDDKVYYEQPIIGNLVWGDHEFGRKGEGIGRNSYFSKLLTQRITKIINVTPLMNHNQVGVTGNLYGLALGSVDNTSRFEGNLDRLEKAVPEIFARPQLSDRVILNVVDALICQYEGDGVVSLLHHSTTLNQLRFSRDPVALDVLSIQELQNQRQLAQAPTVATNMDLYTYYSSDLLQLGVGDVKRIRVETLKAP